MKMTPEVEATNAAAVATIPAPAAGFANIVKEIEVSYSGAPAGGLVSITDGRLDANCGTTLNSPTVTDAAILATDVGKKVTGTGVPANAVVGTVVAGVSFQIMVAGVAANATATGVVTLDIGRTVDMQVDIAAAGAQNIPLPAAGLRCSTGQATTITLAAGGVGIIGRVNIGYDVGA